MRKDFWVKGAGLAVALGTLAAIAGCDTNSYGDSGAQSSTTTTTTTAVPPTSSTTTTVMPNPDGSVTTTERTQRNY